MLYVDCDCCGKNIPAPKVGVTFIPVFEKELCVPCRAKLESAISEMMSKEKIFRYKDYYKYQKIALAKFTK